MNTEWFAIFSYMKEEVLVEIPAFNINIKESNYDDAYNSASKIIKKELDSFIKNGMDIPDVNHQDIHPKPNQEVIVIAT